MPWQQEHEAAGHIAAVGRRQREANAAVHVSPLNLGTPAPGIVPPTLGVCLLGDSHLALSTVKINCDTCAHSVHVSLLHSFLDYKRHL